MNSPKQLAVTLTAALYERLMDEARKLDVPLEWLVASLVVDTIDADRSAAAIA
jgi:hypothetical protein